MIWFAGCLIVNSILWCLGILGGDSGCAFLGALLLWAARVLVFLVVAISCPVMLIASCICLWYSLLYVLLFVVAICVSWLRVCLVCCGCWCLLNCVGCAIDYSCVCWVVLVVFWFALGCFVMWLLGCLLIVLD